MGQFFEVRGSGFRVMVDRLGAEICGLRFRIKGFGFKEFTDEST